MTTGKETNEGQTQEAPIHSEWVAVTSLVTGGTVFFSDQPEKLSEGKIVCLDPRAIANSHAAG